MVSIRNFTARPIRAPLTVMVGEENPVREDIEIGAEGRRVFIYPYRAMNQVQLASEIGITQSELSRVMSGFRTLRKYHLLALECVLTRAKVDVPDDLLAEAHTETKVKS